MNVSIRAMTWADIPLGMRLKEHAGWNQIEADWKRLLDLEPHGAFVAEVGDLPVGTVTSCRFGEVAWVAMMLVDAAYRGRGVGRALMVRVLDWLSSQGALSMRLDATPLGRPLYESLGFRPEATFVRYQGVPRLSAASARPGDVVAGEVFDDIVALDHAVTGAHRAALLRRLAREHPESFHVARQQGRVRGFVMARPGARARQLGPCVADEAAGACLLDDALNRYAGETVILDVPREHATAAVLLASRGLMPARELVRMGLGPRVAEDLDRLWASAGAEKG